MSSSSSLSETEYRDFRDPASEDDDSLDNTSAVKSNRTTKEKSMASVFHDLLKQKSSSQKDPVLARRSRLLSAPDEAALDRKAQAILRRERKSTLAKLRVLPNPATDAARERALRRAATKGAVQLFNAVYKHQQAQEADKTSKDSKKPRCAAPIMSNNSNADFMDLLKKGPAKII